MAEPIHQFNHGKLPVRVFANTLDMAETAAAEVAKAIAGVLSSKDHCNMIIPGGASQVELHRVLARRKDIDWPRVHGFSVDDFHAPNFPPECAVAAQPQRDLCSHVPMARFEVVDYAAADAEAERDRYEQVLLDNPADILLLGIGVVGHLAFNEPGQTDFNDTQTVRIIDITEESKRQLMNDENFNAVGVIPEKGITMTIAALRRVSQVFVVVPYEEKAAIIKRFLESDVTPDLPASILRDWDGARLYLDADSYSLS